MNTLFIQSVNVSLTFRKYRGWQGVRLWIMSNKKLTWFSANIADLPVNEPRAFGIHVLVKTGCNNSWLWSGQMTEEDSLLFPSMNRYWRVFKKLNAILGPTFGIFESISSTKFICTGGRTIIWFQGTKTVRVTGRKGERWYCNVIAPPPLTKMSNLLD